PILRNWFKNGSSTNVYSDIVIVLLRVAKSG
ncbi:MAG: hypothetical protein ACI8WB_004143, partial [Phenylobacterium sp.]